MQINAIRKMMGLAAVLAVLAGTTAVNAQSGAQGEGGSFDQPLKSSKGQARSTVMMTDNDGEHTYTVRVEGDKVSAEIDGKPVPKDQVRNRNGRVEILDENKEVIKSFNIQAGTNMMRTPTAPRRFQVETVEPGQQGAQGGGWGGNWVASEPPKAMMGITMTDAGDDAGASIDSVVEDMPAEKAGVKVGDVVVEANGKKITGQLQLREIIRELDPGDVLNLKVDRDGKKVDLKVKLEKWDQSKMMTFAPAQSIPGFAFGGVEGIESAREAVENALAILKDNEKLDGKNREKVQKALEKALKSMEKANQHSNLFERDAEGQMRIYGPQGRAFTVPAPTPPGAVNDDLARQLEKLHAQMERMNKRMEELEKNR